MRRAFQKIEMIEAQEKKKEYSRLLKGHLMAKWAEDGSCRGAVEVIVEDLRLNHGGH